MLGPMESKPGKIQSVEILPYHSSEPFTQDYVVSLAHHISGVGRLVEHADAAKALKRTLALVSDSWGSWLDLSRNPTFAQGVSVAGWG